MVCDGRTDALFFFFKTTTRCSKSTSDAILHVSTTSSRSSLSNTTYTRHASPICTTSRATISTTSTSVTNTCAPPTSTTRSPGFCAERHVASWKYGCRWGTADYEAWHSDVNVVAIVDERFSFWTGYNLWRRSFSWWDCCTCTVTFKWRFCCTRDDDGASSAETFHGVEFAWCGSSDAPVTSTGAGTGTATCWIETWNRSGSRACALTNFWYGCEEECNACWGDAPASETGESSTESANYCYE